MDEVRKWIKKRLRRGDSRETIRKKLIDRGHDAKDVDSLISSVRTGSRIGYILAVSVLVVIGIYFFSQSHVLGTGSAAAPSSEQPSDQEILNLASIADNVSLCGQISDTDVREDCSSQFSAMSGRNLTFDERLYHAALLAGNSSLCANISDSSLRAECSGEFMTADAGTVSQDQELFNIAVLVGNASVCQDIGDEQLRTQCLRTV